MAEKIFRAKDFYYNNGLVNIKKFLKGRIENLNIELCEDCLKLSYPEEKEEEIQKNIFSFLVEELHIVYRTSNKRLYYDDAENDFVCDYRINVKDAASGNDVKYTLKYISPAKLGTSTESLYSKCIDFCKKNDWDIKDFKVDDMFKKSGKFKEDKKCEIPLYPTIEQAAENYTEYCFNSGNVKIMKFDSKIHTFKGGDNFFYDMLRPDDYIDTWDMIIYFYGVKSKKFYNNMGTDTFVLLPNSSNLKTLYSLKSDLNISDFNISDKNGKEIKTNFNLYEVLSKDGITNKNIYITNNEEEFTLKTLMYIFSYLTNLNGDDDKKVQRILDDISGVSFVSYVDSVLKPCLNEYTKAYRLFNLFEELKDADLYKYAAVLLQKMSICDEKNKDKSKTLTRNFCTGLMKFGSLRKLYLRFSFVVLKNEGLSSFGKEFYSFEKIYIKFTDRGEKYMNLYEKGKILGEEIGIVSANLESRDYLYKLRNVKNHGQFVSYMASFDFEVLKKDSTVVLSKEFKKQLDDLLSYLNENEEDWEIVKDYTAIYAINKYKDVTYAKNANRKGEEK